MDMIFTTDAITKNRVTKMAILMHEIAKRLSCKEDFDEDILTSSYNHAISTHLAQKMLTVADVGYMKNSKFEELAGLNAERTEFEAVRTAEREKGYSEYYDTFEIYTRDVRDTLQVFGVEPICKDVMNEHIYGKYNRDLRKLKYSDDGFEITSDDTGYSLEVCMTCCYIMDRYIIMNNLTLNNVGKMFWNEAFLLDKVYKECQGKDREWIDSQMPLLVIRHLHDAKTYGYGIGVLPKASADDIVADKDDVYKLVSQLANIMYNIQMYKKYTDYNMLEVIRKYGLVEVILSHTALLSFGPQEELFNIMAEYVNLATGKSKQMDYEYEYNECPDESAVVAKLIRNNYELVDAFKLWYRYGESATRACKDCTNDRLNKMYYYIRGAERKEDE